MFLVLTLTSKPDNLIHPHDLIILCTLIQKFYSLSKYRITAIKPTPFWFLITMATITLPLSPSRGSSRRSARSNGKDGDEEETAETRRHNYAALCRFLYLGAPIAMRHVFNQVWYFYVFIYIRNVSFRDFFPYSNPNIRFSIMACIEKNSRTGELQTQLLDT